MRIASASRHLLGAVSALALIFLPTSQLFASTMDYTFTGVGTGTVTGNTNTTFTDFTVTFSLDTSDIVVPDTGYTRYNDVSGTFTEGSYTTTFVDATIVANGNPDTGMGAFETVFLFNSDFGSSIGINSDPALLNYSLANAIDTGVVSGGGVGSADDAAGFSTTTGDQVDFTSLTSLEFVAAAPGAEVPEPSSLPLLTFGMVGIALATFRKLRTRPE